LPEPAPETNPPTLSAGMIALLAAASGIIAANIYYAQPLIGPISVALDLPTQTAGLIVTVMQVGYGAGLLLIAPLADRLENRRLTLASVALGTLGLIGAGLSHNAALFLACSLIIGLGSVGVQILVPLAGHLAPPASRGRIVGDVTTGIMLGVMLARPISSLIAANSSWRAVFFAAAIAMATIAVILAYALPERRPTTRTGYGELFSSMVRLAYTQPVLRPRAAYQACLFGAFSLFWTTTPLLLAGPFHLTQTGIALFALAGVSGAIAAPIGGRIADRGHSRVATGLAITTVAIAYLLTDLAPAGTPLALALLVAAAILVDFGAQTNLVLGFRAIYGLDATVRARLNGLYIATFFCSGAIGSALGAWAYAEGGWRLASTFGLAFPALALALFATEFRQVEQA